MSESKSEMQRRREQALAEATSTGLTLEQAALQAQAMQEQMRSE